VTFDPSHFGPEAHSRSNSEFATVKHRFEIWWFCVLPMLTIAMKDAKKETCTNG